MAVNNKPQKSLSEVFKELERDKNRQVQLYKEEEKARLESSFIFCVKQRTKKDNIILVLIVLIFLFIISLFSRNYIFAVSLDDEQKNEIGVYEKNDNPKDVYEILSKNMSNTEQKEIIDIEENIEFKTVYISNKDMPEDETKTLQEGIIGKKIVTYVRSFENNNMIDQISIGEKVLTESQNQIIEIGTSKVLKQYNIHIGDKLYTSKDVELKKNVNVESDNWIIIPKFYDVKALEVIDECWIKVSYDDKNTGFILANYLTSETLTPGISEICKNTKILSKVNFNMQLNEPSGLNLDDYKKIFSNLENDTNNIFKENYKSFYEAEQKYGINGIFLASIAVHESNWGKSTIAKDKHNLFGFGAYDVSPYESAVLFDSYSEGINTVAIWLVNNYLNSEGTVLKNGNIASGRYYNGATVSGVNKRYASDVNWAVKVYITMQNLYNRL